MITIIITCTWDGFIAIMYRILHPFENLFSMKTKKRMTNISTGLFFLFGGIEYGK